MVSIFGQSWEPRELQRRVGSMDQMAGIKFAEALDGRERGVRMFQAWTGSGLAFRVLGDRALDISALSFKGIPLAWNSMVGDVHPSYYEPQGLGWLRTFPGGLLATCGLDQFGAPSVDQGEELGVHGRISNLPASHLSYRTEWEGDTYMLEISGQARQTRVFGENLVLRRRISTELGARWLRIEDEVTNEGFSPHPHLILYHFNLGFPLVSSDTELRLDAKLTEPRDAVAAPGIGDWMTFHEPQAGYQEQVFHHVPEADTDGRAQVELANPALGLGLRWTYDTENLPHLFEWKQMGEAMYVVGIEPANSSGIGGRAAARESGDLPILEPGESRRYAFHLEVLEY